MKAISWPDLTLLSLVFASLCGGAATVTEPFASATHFTALAVASSACPPGMALPKTYATASPGRCARLAVRTLH